MKILLSWSGGKDSAWALHRLRSVPELASTYEVAGLVTTVNEVFRRVAIQGLREELLDRQAKETGLPLWKVGLPFPCANANYEERMAAVYARAKAEGIGGIAFGDLFLEEIRAYRLRPSPEPASKQSSRLGDPHPRTSRDHARRRPEGPHHLLRPPSPRRIFAGREWNAALLSALPQTVDPCGENGEFHTFCYAGPMFQRAISVVSGETVERDRFCYADLITATLAEDSLLQVPYHEVS